VAAKRPSRRYRQFTDRRLEILRSAAAAFTRSSFTRATMGDIAEKVKMAKGISITTSLPNKTFCFSARTNPSADCSIERQPFRRRKTPPTNN
jgi:hypothetical protein